MTRAGQIGSGLTQELVELPGLSQSEPDRYLLALLSHRSAVPFDEVAASFDQGIDFAGMVRHLVAEGLVYLEAVEYIWGIELQLGLTEAGRTASRPGQRAQPTLEVGPRDASGGTNAATG